MTDEFERLERLPCFEAMGARYRHRRPHGRLVAVRDGAERDLAMAGHRGRNRRPRHHRHFRLEVAEKSALVTLDRAAAMPHKKALNTCAEPKGGKK